MYIFSVDHKQGSVNDKGGGHRLWCAVAKTIRLIYYSIHIALAFSDI